MADSAPSQNVTFRLRGPLLQALQARAQDSGASLHSAARELVIAELQDERTREVRRELGALREELASLRSDVATSLELVLLNLAKVDKESVRQFVSDRLRAAR